MIFLSKPELLKLIYSNEKYCFEKNNVLINIEMYVLLYELLFVELIMFWYLFSFSY
jgi:hypothetical protein